MNHLWDNVEQIRARQPGLTVILVGVEESEDTIQNWIREERKTNVRLADVKKKARALGVHAIGCCSLAKDLPNLFCKLLWSCLELVAETKRQHQEPLVVNRVAGVWLREIIAAPPALKKSRVIKVLVLGNQAAGKTSLLGHICTSKKSRRGAGGQQAEMPSTIGIDTLQLDLIRGVSVVAYDFAGQLESARGAVYVLVVDGSREDPSPREQLSQWLEMLWKHAQGPRSQCRVIVAVNKIDKLAEQLGKPATQLREAAEIAEAEAEAETAQWGFVREMGTRGSRAVGVCGKTGWNADRLHAAIASAAREVLALDEQRVASVDNELSRAIEALGRARDVLVMTTEEVRAAVPERLRRDLDAGEHWEDALDVLHNAGQVVLVWRSAGQSWAEGLGSSADQGLVCLAPGVLSKALSLFVAPPEHLERLGDHKHGSEARRETMTLSRAVDIVAEAPFLEGLASRPEQARRIVSVLEMTGLCYAAEDGDTFALVFPGLLSRCELAMLPPSAREGAHSSVEAAVHGGEMQLLRALVAVLRVLLGRMPDCLQARVLQDMCAENGEVPVMCQRNEEGRVVAWPRQGRTEDADQRHDCGCWERVEPEERVLARRIPHESGTADFCRLLAKLHGRRDRRFQAFSNLAVLLDACGNSVLVSLQERDRPGAAAEGSRRRAQDVVVVARGVAPETWRATVPELGEGAALCPTCIQGNLCSELSPDGAAPGALRCACGHPVGPREAELGVPEDAAGSRQNALWRPRWGQLFFEETDRAGLWAQRADDVLVSRLCALEPTPARRSEYVRASTLFYGFVGREAQGRVWLDSVEVAFSKELERRFSEQLQELAGRAMARGPDGSPGASLPLELPRAEQVRGQDSEAQQRWRRQWATRFLGQHVARVSGSGGANLILGWRGELCRDAQAVVATNFPMPEAASLDCVFGRGVYFTQCPSHGASFAAAAGSSGPADEHCLVASWLLLGRAFPVTSAPAPGAPGSLCGSECTEGFDSHYVVLPFSASAGIRQMEPYDPLSRTAQTVGSDQIVIFKQSQILPRYIFHYHVVPVAPRGHGAKSSGAPSVPALLPHTAEILLLSLVLWVSDCLDVERETSETQEIRARAEKIVPMTSSEELRVWLRYHGAEVASKLRVVTNGYRAGDGGDNAARKVVNFVRGAVGDRVPVLVYTGTPERHKPLTKLRHVLVSKEPQQVACFCATGKLRAK
eukprot:m51a1_g4989 hypothetical protein (1205) ;mRNA; r:94449-98677